MNFTVIKGKSEVSLSTPKTCQTATALLTRYSALDENGWATSCPCRLTILKELWYPMNRRLDGPHSRSADFGKEKPDIFTLMGRYAAFIRSQSPKFRDTLSVLSSRVKQSKTTA